MMGSGISRLHQFRGRFCSESAKQAVNRWRKPKRGLPASNRNPLDALGFLRHPLELLLNNLKSESPVCPACRRGALRSAAGLHGDARTGSKSLLRSEASRKPAGFPDPVSMTVCPCIVLGFPRVSGRRSSPGRQREPCRVPSSSRRPRRSAPSGSPARPRPASAISSPAARLAKDRRFRAAHRMTAIAPATSSRLRSR